MWSMLAAVSLNEWPSGAMSRSWKHQNGTVSFSKNSNAAAIFGLGHLDRVAGPQPRTIERAVTEHIGAVPVEAVPVAGGESQMITHRATGDRPDRRRTI